MSSSYYPTTATGDRYADSDGNTYIVVSVDDGCPLLLEDFDILDDPDGFELDTVIWDEAERSGPLRPIEADPEMTRIITDRVAHQEAVARIMAGVPAEQHRDLYNTLVAFRYWGGKMAEAQVQINEYAKQRGSEGHKLVAIVGTQDKAATLLGMNQSTLSRALRDR